MKKLDETSLPPKEAFYSKLIGDGITDEDCQRTQIVWKEFNIVSMKHYHNLYNLSDVLLLADIFDNFRNICMKLWIGSGLVFQCTRSAGNATLKITEVQLKLLNDPDIWLMIESGIRGDRKSVV